MRSKQSSTPAAQPALGGPSSAAPTVASVPRERAERVARARCTVLLEGATGTGKGYLARWLHENGPRRGGEFIPVNCGALPAGVVDSHLFGHARGSFSDAHGDHPGLVRQAEGGTLFLDEIADLPWSAQVKLLRLLEEREVQPVGATRPVPVDVRIVAATARDLAALVADGAFRVDLYYRLNVVNLRLAPLGERPAEFFALLGTLNAELAGSIGRAPLSFSESARDLLLRYDWPGNVRELRSVLERLHVLAGDAMVTPHELRTLGQLTPPPGEGRVDCRLLAARRLLAEADGNVSEAARRLGVHRSTVHRWLHRVPA